MQTSDHPLYRRGRHAGWLEAGLWVLGFVAVGLLYRQWLVT